MSIKDMSRVESDFHAAYHYHLCRSATIKCDHQGIWEGSAGSLCLAPAQERVVSGRKNPHSTTFLVQQSKLCESRASQTCIREPGGTIIPVVFMKVRWYNINYPATNYYFYQFVSFKCNKAGVLLGNKVRTLDPRWRCSRIRITMFY